MIGNPPYVRQEQIRALKPALRKAYQAFDGMADLYVYFYELGLRLLRPGGRLSYVVTNKWLRAGYAEELRAHLSSKGWLEAVADFGHAKKFFPGADVFPCVIVARCPDGTDPPDQTEVCQIPRDVVHLDRVSQQVSDLAFPLPRASFTRQAWALDPPEVAALMDKIRRAGVSLEEYAGTKPYRGVLTGYNEAFLIDTSTRDALVAADPECAEIIKPYLRGQDIERWYAPWQGFWMIVLQSSANKQWPWSDAGRDAELLFQQTFPSLHRHLASFRAELETRQDKGRFWWELRVCSYYQQFEAAKVIYQEIQYHAAFALDCSAAFSNNKVFLIGSDDPYMIAALNSPMMWWHNWRYLSHLKDEALTPQAYRMERLPIARPSDPARTEAAEAVGRLVNTKMKASKISDLLRDWYSAELGISRQSEILLNPFGLSSDEFVEQIRKARGSRKPLSAAAVHAVREEYAKTVQPIQSALREAERLEWRLNDLVNKAYGLTPDEVRLMWDTAPPRMPLTPDAAAPTQAGSEAAAQCIKVRCTPQGLRAVLSGIARG